MLSAYPKLSEIILPEWKEDENIDKIIRYVIMVYDPKSPLQRDEKDLIRRKSASARLAVLNTTDSEFINGIYDGSNQICFGIITNYLVRFIKDKEFAALCAFQYKYFENIKELLTPISGETNAERLEAARKKSVISDEIDKDILRIDDYWQKVYGDNILTEQIKSKRITPESIAGFERL